MTAGYDDARRRSTLQRAIITAVVVLIAVTALGSWIMRLYGITTPAFRIAGGIIFLGIGDRKRQRSTLIPCSKTMSTGMPAAPSLPRSAWSAGRMSPRLRLKATTPA